MDAANEELQPKRKAPEYERLSYTKSVFWFMLQGTAALLESSMPKTKAFRRKHSCVSGARGVREAGKVVYVEEERQGVGCWAQFPLKQMTLLTDLGET